MSAERGSSRSLITLRPERSAKFERPVFLAVYLASAALALGLAACGGSSSSGTGVAASPPTAAAPSPSNSQAPAAGPHRGGGKGSQGGSPPQGSSTAESTAAAVPGPRSSSSPTAAKPKPTPGAATGPPASTASTSVSSTSSGARSSPKVVRPKPPRRKRAAHRPHRAGAAAFLQPEGDNSIPNYGSEASAGERAAAQTALGAYLSARAGGEWAGACALMASQVQKQLGALSGSDGESCAAAYAKLSSGISASERASPLIGSLAALRVEGENAFALFYGPGARQYMMPLRSEGGAWKVTQIAAIPYPVGAPTASQ